MYPDQSLYPVNSVPEVVRAINGALLRADQIDHAEGNDEIDWLVPIVADTEAGFGGHLNVFELTKAMIEAGAAGVHLEDQLASEKKCGHMGGKVLLPTQPVRSATSSPARLAADVSASPTLIVARTDADAADADLQDVDERDHGSSPASAPRRASSAQRRASSRRSRAASPTRPTPTCSGARPPSPTWSRPSASPTASTPRFPGKLLAYNCSPSFNWKGKLDDDEIAGFQRELGEHGLPLPVHHPRRLPHAQPLDVRARPRLPRATA